MVGHGVAVHLAQSTFLRADATGKVTKVVHCQGDVGVQRFADRLSVVHRFHICQQLQIGFEPVRDLEQDVGPLCGRGLAPRFERSMGSVQRQLDIGCGGAGCTGVRLASDRRNHVKVVSFNRWHKFATNEIVVLRLELHRGVGRTGFCIQHVVCLQIIEIVKTSPHAR